jgi:uncharacterized protein YdeI (YjbR/CyaY-like superfamily)
MKITETLYVKDAKAWRAWLRKHYKTKPEIWLIYYKKKTGKPRISYNDAVEEALCFGWIDSIQKRLDEDRTVQRFSPRKPGTKYSQQNQERLRALLKQKKVVKAVADSLKGTLNKPFTIPPDILRRLKANSRAWKNFQKFSKPYQRIRIAYIDGARKRPAEFKKRLKHLIDMTAQNKQFGYGGIDKHY